MKILFLWTKLDRKIPSPSFPESKDKQRNFNPGILKFLLFLAFISLIFGFAMAFLANHSLPATTDRKGKIILETIGLLFFGGNTHEASSVTSNKTAAEHLKRALQLHYEDVNILSAIPEYEKAVMLDPENPDLHYALANAYLTQIATVSFAEAAIRELEKVIQLDPFHIKAYRDLALLYSTYHRIDYEKAFKILEKGRQVAPTDIEILMALGELSMRQQKPLTARAYLWEARRLNPTDPRPYNAIGQTYYEEGLFDDSIKYFQEALHLLEEVEDERLLALYGPFSSDLQAAQVSGKLNMKIEERGW
jgi:Tfp pilus assembly protein PilF